MTGKTLTQKELESLHDAADVIRAHRLKSSTADDTSSDESYDEDRSVWDVDEKQAMLEALVDKEKKSICTSEMFQALPEIPIGEPAQKRPRAIMEADVMSTSSCARCQKLKAVKSFPDVKALRRTYPELIQVSLPGWSNYIRRLINDCSCRNIVDEFDDDAHRD
jgi:hypothetical protein